MFRAPSDGMKVRAEKAGRIRPARDGRMQSLKFGRFTRSSALNSGDSSRARIAASRWPTRKAASEPTFPNTARASSSGSWSTYWWQIVRQRRCLRDSARITAKLSFAKCWNSSTSR